jgi:hypothetical protein
LARYAVQSFIYYRCRGAVYKPVWMARRDEKTQ